MPDEHDVVFDLSVVAFPEFWVRNELLDDRTLAFEEPPHLLGEQGRVVEAQLQGAELKQKQPETRLSKKNGCMCKKDYLKTTRISIENYTYANLLKKMWYNMK